MQAWPATILRQAAGVAAAAVAARLLGGRPVERSAEPVPAELLEIAEREVDAEVDRSEKLNLRATAVIALCGVLLTFNATFIKDVVSRLQAPSRSSTQSASASPLDLGPVGEPVLLICFGAAVLALLGASVLALGAVLPRSGAALGTVALSRYRRARIAVPEVRRRVFILDVVFLRTQRATNRRKNKLLRGAFLMLVVGLLLVGAQGTTLAVRQLGL